MRLNRTKRIKPTDSSSQESFFVDIGFVLILIPAG